MRSFLQLPVLRELHARSLLFPTIVLLLVVGVLIHGALTPESVDETAEAAAPEPPPLLPNLRPDLEKTPLSYTADYWSQLGETLRRNLVLVGRDGTPGVVIAPRTVLAAFRAADELLAEQLENVVLRERLAQERAAEEGNAIQSDPSADNEAAGDSESETAAVGPNAPAPPRPFSPAGVDLEHGVALFELGSTVSATHVRRADPGALKPGAHIAAISLTPDRDLRITPGVLVSVAEGSGYPEQDATIGERFDVAIPFPAGTRTAAIVDLDGGLLGVAVESPSGIRVLSAATVEQIAGSLGERRPCLSIETRDLTDEVRRVLRVRSGVLVERVHREAFLPEPSILPGDILTRWAGRDVDQAGDWEQHYGDQEPGSLVRYVLRRGKRRLSGATRMPGPDCRPVAHSLETFAALGLVLRWDAERDGGAPEGWTVMGAVEDAAAAQGGLVRGDRIVAVQGEALTLGNRRRALLPFERRGVTLVMTVWRGDRVLLIAVAPPAEPEDEPAQLQAGEPAPPV